MHSIHEVLLELTRGHDAHVNEAPPREETQYLLRRGNGAYVSARFPWSEPFLADLEAIRGRNPDSQARQRVGGILRAFLQSLGWSALEVEILRALGGKSGSAEVRVTVRCNVAELCRLPLELLPLEPGGESLGLKEGCHVQWEWPDSATATRTPDAPPEGGTLLFAWSAAGGGLDAAGQLGAIRQAAAIHRHPGPVVEVRGASVDSLRRALESARDRNESVAVLHILCHGGPLAGAEGGHGLWLDAPGEAGGAELVDPVRFAEALAPHVGRMGCLVLCACNGANLAGSANALGSVAQRLHRAGVPAVVASRAPLSSAGAEAFTRAFHGALLSGAPFHRAVADGRRELGAEWSALQVYARAQDGPQYPVVFRPYRGLQAFEEDDRRFFFGREALSRELLERIVEAWKGGRSRFQIAAGSSGSGKSSLAKAGLVPVLRSAGWRIAVLRPGGDGGFREVGLARLARALRDLRDLREGAAAVEGAADEAAVIAEARSFRARWPDDPCLVVVDQLEEAFKLEGNEPQRFLECLWKLARDEALKVVVLGTFRADLLERAEDVLLEGGVTLQSLFYRKEHLLYVSRMSPEELLDAIQRPLEEVGLSFEPGVAEHLRDEAGKEPGALPLLEHAMDALWQAREGRKLTRAAYERFGGLAGALSRQLDLLWDRLPEGQQRQGQRLLVALVDFADDASLSTRRRSWVERLRPDSLMAGAAFDAALEMLVAQRLLVRGQLEERAAADGGGWVEIAHEALIRRWTRLQGWLRGNRTDQELLRELESVAITWSERRNATDKGDSDLPGGGKLEAFEELERRLGPLAPGPRRCLQAARDKRQRTRRRTRAAIAALVAGVLGLSVLSVVALVQRRTAVRERNAALSRELTAVVAARIEEPENGDPQLDLALLRQARSLANTERIVPTLAKWEHAPGRSVLRGHSGPVVSAAFSPDGTRVVTASLDHTARLWDVSSSNPIAILSGHSDAVVTAAFSPDGLRIVTASGDGIPRVWDASSGKELTRLHGHSGPVNAAAFSRDSLRIVTAGCDGTARVWDASSGKGLAILPGHSDIVVTAVFSPNGLRVVTASDRTVRIWDASSGRLLAALPKQPGLVLDATFSPGGSRILTTGLDDTARIWDASSFKLLATLPISSTLPILERTPAFSPDGRRIVATGRDATTAQLWDTASGHLLLTLRGHSDKVAAAAFSSDGRRVLTASADRTARIWDASSGELLATFSGHIGGVVAAAFSPDGLHAVTASLDYTARLWDASPGQPSVTLSAPYARVDFAAFGPDGLRIVTADGAAARVWDTSGQLLTTLFPGQSISISTAIFSPDGMRIATGGHDDVARIWEASSGKPMASVSKPSPVVTFSPDGLRIVTGSDDGKSRVWDAASGSLLATLSGHSMGLTDVAVSPDGLRMVTASHDGAARLWDASGKLLATLSGHSNSIVKATFSPDGLRIVTSSRDGTVRVWDGSSGELLTTISGHDGQVTAAAFSPNGLHVVTTSDDNTARIWSISGKLLVTLTGHTGRVNAAAFSPDGLHVVTASDDDTVRVWGASSGEVQKVLSGHTRPVMTAAFSPDGFRIVTVDKEGTARVWRDLIWAPAAFQEALLSSGRELTPGERRTYLHEDIGMPGHDERASPGP